MTDGRAYTEEDGALPPEAPGGVRRAALWGLLATVLVAVGVAYWLAPRWAEEAETPEPLPVVATIGALDLTASDGRAVGLAELSGRPWVADLIFTRCALTCPRMTAQMKRLGELVPASVPMRRVSISVDPEHDTPAVLAAYAESRGARAPDWLFLTGTREEIGRVAFEELRVGFDDEPPPEMASALEPIVHSTRFVLVDAGGRIRGYYDPFDGVALAHLARDVARLAAEVGE